MIRWPHRTRSRNLALQAWTIALLFWAAPSSWGSEWQERPLRERILKMWREDSSGPSKVYIRYEDTLGDGPGTWDPRPLVRTLQKRPSENIQGEFSNCINWTLETIARTYAPNPSLQDPETGRYLNTIRYYGGRPTWGLRKHFVDQMLEHSPGPLGQVMPSELPASCQKILKRRKIHLDLDGFAKRSGYACQLPSWSSSAKATAEEISFSYLDWEKPQAFLTCMRDLPARTYALFAVATEANLATYGTRSGVMGRVHSGFLLRAPQNSAVESPHLYHASIRADFPIRERIDIFRRKTKKWFRGVQLFQLPEHWDGQIQTTAEDASKFERILQCERELVSKKQTRQSFDLAD